MNIIGFIIPTMMGCYCAIVIVARTVLLCRHILLAKQHQHLMLYWRVLEDDDHYVGMFAEHSNANLFKCTFDEVLRVVDSIYLFVF